MRGVNKIILLGNATRDAELRHTQSGKPVASIRLATNRQVGERESTQYHSIVCWDTLAEITSQYVKKGDPLYVEGRLEYRSFQDEEGKERGVAEIIASDVQFLAKKPAVQEPGTAAVDDRPLEELSLDDLPFA